MRKQKHNVKKPSNFSRRQNDIFVDFIYFIALQKLRSKQSQRETRIFLCTFSVLKILLPKKTILKTSLKLVPSKALEPKRLIIESVSFNIFETKRFG